MGLQQLQQQLIHHRILPVLNSLLSCHQNCYLVGGAVRDALRNRLSRDFDFTTPYDPSDLARGLAKALEGTWFMLDASRRQSRVVIGQGQSRAVCDFAPFRATSLDGDLQRRDYTINAMVLPLQADGCLGDLYDPLGGQNDLHSGNLRYCSAQALSDDPLRILKGLRHCLYLHLAIDPDTLDAMRQAAPRIVDIAPERIRSELGALFDFTPARRALVWLREVGLLDRLLPTSVTTPIGSGLSLLDRAEAWMACLIRADDSGRLGEFFAHELEQDISHAVAFKMAAWFHGQGMDPGQALAVLQNLRCSRALQRAVTNLLSLDPHMIETLERLPPVGRSRALWAEDLGSHPHLAACFAGLLADLPFSEAAQLVLKALDDLRHCRVKGRVPTLVSGRWLRKTLHLEGPEVGTYLAALRREEIAGRVLNAQQAEQFLLQLHKSGGQKID